MLEAAARPVTRPDRVMDDTARRRPWVAPVLLTAASAAAASVVGCATITDTAGEMWFQTVGALKPNGGDRLDGTDETGKWDEVGEYATQARGGRVKDDDDWYKNTFMSPKARDIERNLGIE